MFSDFLVKQLFNVFLFLYAWLHGHDFGVVVVIFTILVRLVLWPLFASSIQSQLTMAKLQPEIEAIQGKYKNNKQTQVAELMKLYKTHKFNPFSGFFSLLIQLPILLAVYQVFQIFGGPLDQWVYIWMPVPQDMNYLFLGLFDLLQPFMWATLAASLLQFLQVLFSLQIMPQKKSQDPSMLASRSMVYLAPVLTFMIFRSLPSVLSLYWSVSSLLSLLQQWLLQKRIKPGALT